MPASRIVVGIHPVRELLRAGRKVHRLQLADTRSSSRPMDELVRLADSCGVPVDIVPRDQLDQAAPGLVHQGVVAEAPAFPYTAFDTLLASASQAPNPALLVAVDGVTDPHNLGSIARSAESFGASGLIIPDRRAASVTPTVEKAAAGALAHLPVATVTNLVRALGVLHEAGVWSLGLDADGDTELAQHPLASEPCVLVVGAEGKGLARLTRQRCDAIVRLPMRGNVASLNASVAAGIALYELARSR